jgi:endonuclease G
LLTGAGGRAGAPDGADDPAGSRAFLKSILSEKDLNDELLKALGSRKSALKAFVLPGAITDLVKSPDKFQPSSERGAFAPGSPEAVILMYQRPILLVQKDSFVPDVIENPALRDRLKDARKRIEAAIPAVGRIELENGMYELPGTGWLVDENIVVTNRHVALMFATQDDKSFTFRSDGGGKVRARIDYLAEHGAIVPRKEFLVTKVLHIEDDAVGKPDLAFLQVARNSADGDRLAKPIRLAARPPAAGDPVVVIGYPSRDFRLSPIQSQFMEQYYGGTYNVKRLSPGLVMPSNAPAEVFHDCSTLTGNSGSVLLDTNTGDAVGLHYGGDSQGNRANYAVPADVVQKRLDEVKKQLG